MLTRHDSPSTPRDDRAMWLFATVQALSPYLLAGCTLWWFGG